MTDKSTKPEVTGCFPQPGYSVGIQTIQGSIGVSFASKSHVPVDDGQSCVAQDSIGLGISMVSSGSISLRGLTPDGS